MTTTDIEKAFEQWWSFPVSRPDVRKSLAREAYYAAWDEAADEIERLRAEVGELTKGSEWELVYQETITELRAEIERLRVMYNDCIKDLREASE